ncbi:hypothetical protein [Streptomyces sp. NPDC001404]|uniref:hypothetical protein n=1 Tax=Streptomyces sp. NPDC001404 TaxID=3364571 RepID=UPI0036A9D6DF
MFPVVLVCWPDRGAAALALEPLGVSFAWGVAVALVVVLAPRCYAKLACAARRDVLPAVRRFQLATLAALLVLLVAWLVRETWTGTGAALAASSVLKAGAAAAAGGVAVSLLLLPVVSRMHPLAQRRGLWLFAASVAAYLAAALFLDMCGVAAGMGMLTGFLCALIAVLVLIWAAVHYKVAEFARVWVYAGSILLAGGWALFLHRAAQASADQVVTVTARVGSWVVAFVVAAMFTTDVVRAVRRRVERRGLAAGAARLLIELIPIVLAASLLAADLLLGGAWQVPVLAAEAWYAVRLWRWLRNRERGAATKAAADVVLALLLGSVVVLFLVTLANLLNLKPVEVEAIRALAEHAKILVEVPWWVWAPVYALLTAGYLAALGMPRRRIGRLALRALDGRRTERIGPAVRTLHRLLTITKIALVLVVFVGTTAPPAVEAMLTPRARSRYTVALRADLAARGGVAFHRKVVQVFRAPSKPHLTSLPELVQQILQAEEPGDELNLAHRLGALQARVVLQAAGAPDQEPAAAAALRTGVTGFDRGAGVSGIGGLSRRLHAQSQEEQREKKSEHLLESLTEAAASAVTSTLGSIGLDDSEVVGIVREYLNGLAESPIRDIFLAQGNKLLSRYQHARQPSIGSMVDPNPDALESAADDQLHHVLSAAGAEPDSDSVEGDAADEPPIQAAVTLAEESMQVEHDPGHCSGCIYYPGSGHGGVNGGNDKGRSNGGDDKGGGNGDGGEGGGRGVPEVPEVPRL